MAWYPAVRPRAAVGFLLPLLALVVACGGPPAEGDWRTEAPPDAPRTLRGMFEIVAGEAAFTACDDRVRRRVARDGDYPSLERAYRQRREAASGRALLATFTGRLVAWPQPGGREPVPGVLVDRFEGLWPGETCGNPGAVGQLRDMYWKVTRLRGRPVEAVPGQREPHLVLHREGSRLAGSGGCNRLGGTYSLRGDTLLVRAAAATRRHCPAGREQEERLLSALRAVVTWRMTGVHLDLQDAAGRTLLRLEERPLP